MYGLFFKLKALNWYFCLEFFFRYPTGYWKSINDSRYILIHLVLFYYSCCKYRNACINTCSCNILQQKKLTIWLPYKLHKQNNSMISKQWNLYLCIYNNFDQHWLGMMTVKQRRHYFMELLMCKSIYGVASNFQCNEIMIEMKIANGLLEITKYL